MSLSIQNRIFKTDIVFISLSLLFYSFIILILLVYIFIILISFYIRSLKHKYIFFCKADTLPTLPVEIHDKWTVALSN